MKYLLTDYRGVEGIIFEVCSNKQEAEEKRESYGGDTKILLCESEEDVKDEKFEGYVCSICQKSHIQDWQKHLKSKEHQKNYKEEK
ncbi:hypothetical protein AKJ59_00855 [candidate division MSBL1 archaeon SCGC-AAA385M02]|uniref:Uncharacterized protein n=1 Tax=candidate division MSBL1 archaeon SCGC-AAA385M02 TaxID=1698287 RepID=A0A133VPT7_9EURY|nr:hypothetical protein AKJ59_00855 [candidate division MSBL1 archaeon SCGC-AAA385M02]